MLTFNLIQLDNPIRLIVTQTPKATEVRQSLEILFT